MKRNLIKFSLYGIVTPLILVLLSFQGGCNSVSHEGDANAEPNDSHSSSENIDATLPADDHNTPENTGSANANAGNNQEGSPSAPSIHDGKLVWFGFVEGYMKAKSERKTLLVDAYTDWCGWCKVMDRETYANATVIAALNKDFICVKFNPELEKTHVFSTYNFGSVELLNWLAQGQPGGYPTSYFIFNPANGEGRASQAGYLPPDKFLNLLVEVLKRK
ncbi:MAG: DUF255 domain-containing protein [Bacteroidetes bacterium]|nr:DUF255 domain-containing protein [Bacteroidota bacterium]